MSELEFVVQIRGTPTQGASTTVLCISSRPNVPWRQRVPIYQGSLDPAAQRPSAQSRTACRTLPR